MVLLPVVMMIPAGSGCSCTSSGCASGTSIRVIGLPSDAEKFSAEICVAGECITDLIDAAGGPVEIFTQETWGLREGDTAEISITLRRPDATELSHAQGELPTVSVDSCDGDCLQIGGRLDVASGRIEAT